MPRVCDLRAYVVESGAGDYYAQRRGRWIIDGPIANPMSIYPAYAGAPTSWGINALGSVLVEVESDDGSVGAGVSTGGEPACYVMEQHLRRFVVGQDPRNVELISDQLWRSTLPHGRKGLALHAISAIDLALWDVLGKLRGEPVYALLGGKTKGSLPVYATTARPDRAKQLGFIGAKVPLPYGPADGRDGLLRNLALAARAREQVGPDFDLTIDCSMALSVPCAIELAKALEPQRIRWIEEPLLPDDYDGYAQVRAAISPCLLAAGEHEYTRYGFRELVARRAVDVLQLDITWVGRITEARRILALAADCDLPVIPHGSTVFGYHLQLAFPNCPFAEYVVLSPNAHEVVPVFGDFFLDEPLPREGRIELPERPGRGVEVNRSARRRRPCPFDRPMPPVDSPRRG